MCILTALTQPGLAAEVECFLQGPEDEGDEGVHLACTPGEKGPAAASRSLNSLHSMPISSHNTTPCGPSAWQVREHGNCCGPASACSTLLGKLATDGAELLLLQACAILPALGM